MISSVIKKITINTQYGSVTIQLLSNAEVIYITPNTINGERLMEFKRKHAKLIEELISSKS
jgi:hypothetical protein